MKSQRKDANFQPADRQVDRQTLGNSRPTGIERIESVEETGIDRHTNNIVEIPVEWKKKRNQNGKSKKKKNVTRRRGKNGRTPPHARMQESRQVKTERGKGNRMKTNRQRKKRNDELMR